MNDQEIQGVAKRIESLVKRVVVAEERGKQQEAALALIAIHMGQDRDAFDPMDLVAHIKASQARSADERAAISEIAKGLRLESWTLPQLVAEAVLAGTWQEYQFRLSGLLGVAGTESLECAIKRTVAELQQCRAHLDSTSRAYDKARAQREELKAERDANMEELLAIGSELEIINGETLVTCARRTVEERNSAKADARYHENLATSIATSCEKHHTNKSSAEKEIAKLKNEVERLHGEVAALDLMLKSKRDAHAAEVESLRAKLNAKTVEWPEWAKEGTRVRVRSTHCSITQAAQYCVGDEFVIEELDEDDWSANAGGRWAFLGDLEPVAEHVAPPVVSPQPKVGDTIRLIKRPELYGGGQWSDVWGIVGQEGKMTENVHHVFLKEPYILVSTQGKGEALPRLREWPLSCVEVVK